jgi:hypothetical protein
MPRFTPEPPLDDLGLPVSGRRGMPWWVLFFVGYFALKAGAIGFAMRHAPQPKTWDERIWELEKLSSDSVSPSEGSARLEIGQTTVRAVQGAADEKESR